MKKKNLIKLITTFLVIAVMTSTSVFAAPAAGTQTETTTQTADTAQAAAAEETPAVISVIAEYPAPAAKGMSAQDFLMGEEHWNWWSSCRETVMSSSFLQEAMDGFYLACMEQLLPAGSNTNSGTNGTNRNGGTNGTNRSGGTSDSGNTVCSPLNIYLAFSMLAEVSDGNTRQQILDMLGMPDIETLRTDAAILWESNYADTPVLKSLPANSIWLNNKVTYNAEPLEILAEQYHASSFSGNPSSEEMNRALRDWTDENTGGLLREYTETMSLDPECVLALISALYYRATWSEHFLSENTSPETFHGTNGDTTVDMMHRTAIMNVYRTYNFTALGFGLNDSGSMYFFLPRNSSDVDSLAADPSIFNVIRSADDEHWIFPRVNLSIPKFRISAKSDLLALIKALDVTDALDASVSDFTPLTKASDQIAVSSAEHAAMVEINEDGVTGAAYTELFLAGSTMPEDEIDFVLDEPFLFIITARDGSILFAGIVRNIS